MPEGVDDAKVRQYLLEQRTIEIAGGFGPLAGKVFRIGLMGYGSTSENVLFLLEALEAALQARRLYPGRRRPRRRCRRAVTMSAPDFTARRAAFRKLHEAGCFVIPNPWDVGTARYLRRLGFPALATSSAGFAFSRGLPDASWAVSRDLMLRHIAEIVAAVDLPVNADFESGYAHDPDHVQPNVALASDGRGGTVH